MPIKGRVLLLAVLVWQLPRIIEALKVPLPMATTVTTELRDGQGKPYTTTTFTSFEPSERVEITPITPVSPDSMSSSEDYLRSVQGYLRSVQAHVLRAPSFNREGPMGRPI